eukprot:scaffold16_cov242-Pinguiococcus_pyrenoidosus.AAC.21
MSRKPASFAHSFINVVSINKLKLRVSSFLAPMTRTSSRFPSIVTIGDGSHMDDRSCPEGDAGESDDKDRLRRRSLSPSLPIATDSPHAASRSPPIWPGEGSIEGHNPAEHKAPLPAPSQLLWPREGSDAHAAAAHAFRQLQPGQRPRPGNPLPTNRNRSGAPERIAHARRSVGSEKLCSAPSAGRNTGRSSCPRSPYPQRRAVAEPQSEYLSLVRGRRPSDQPWGTEPHPKLASSAGEGRLSRGASPACAEARSLGSRRLVSYLCNQPKGPCQKLSAPPPL